MSNQNKLNRINEITDLANKENRDLTEDETQEVERLTDEIYSE